MQIDSNRSPTEASTNQTDEGTASALVNLVRSHSSVLSVEMLRLSIPPSVEMRPGAQIQHQRYADEARRNHRLGGSFTEAFLAEADLNDDLSSALDLVDFHQRFNDAPFSVTIPRSDFTAEAISDLEDETPPGQILVLTSRVRTADGVRHIPLLDFKISAKPRNLDAVKFVSGRLGGGLLVNSGNSYHLYGLKLLSNDDLYDWLLHAQLFSRCVDTRWVTHQLIERCAALRLSRGGGRNVYPTPIGVIAPIES